MPLGAAMIQPFLHSIVEEGEYGWCEACGEAIAPGRLEIDPTALLCIDCASQAETT